LCWRLLSLNHLVGESQQPNGQAIAYIYSRENEAEARQVTADEARRIAANIPELLGRAERD
jgi:hypothetical protein